MMMNGNAAKWWPIGEAPKGAAGTHMADGPLLILKRGSRITVGCWSWRRQGIWVTWDGGFTGAEPPLEYMPLPGPEGYAPPTPTEDVRGLIERCNAEAAYLATSKDFTGPLSVITTLRDAAARLSTPPSSPVSGEGEPVAQPMATAPKDHTWVRLLVDYSGDHNDSRPLFDSDKPSWTLGYNGFADTGEDDEWVFVGWDWDQDCIVETREGTPIGWLPFHAPSRPPEPAASGERPNLSFIKRAEVTVTRPYMLHIIKQDGGTIDVQMPRHVSLGEAKAICDAINVALTRPPEGNARAMTRTALRIGSRLSVSGTVIAIAATHIDFKPDGTRGENWWVSNEAVDAAVALPADDEAKRIRAALDKWARLRGEYQLIGGTGRALTNLADAEKELAALAQPEQGGTT